jgi:hypothetical protein
MVGGKVGHGRQIYVKVMQTGGHKKMVCIAAFTPAKGREHAPDLLKSSPTL